MGFKPASVGVAVDDERWVKLFQHAAVLPEQRPEDLPCFRCLCFWRPQRPLRFLLRAYLDCGKFFEKSMKPDRKTEQANPAAV